MPSRSLSAASIAVCLVAAASCRSSGPEGLPEADGLVRRGDEALVAGRLDEARELFLQAASDAPRAYLAWVGIARTAAARGDQVELDRALAEAMARDVGSPESADLLGRTFLLAARSHRVPDARYGQIQAVSGKALFTAFDLVGTLDNKDWDDDDSQAGTLRAWNFKDLRS